jgi:hypothetical protein
MEKETINWRKYIWLCEVKLCLCLCMYHAMQARSGQGCHTSSILDLDIDWCTGSFSLSRSLIFVVPTTNCTPLNSVFRITLFRTCCDVIKISSKQCHLVKSCAELKSLALRVKNVPIKCWQFYSSFPYLCIPSYILRMHDSVTNDFSILPLDCQVTHVSVCFNTARVLLSLWFSQVNWSVEMWVSHAP